MRHETDSRVVRGSGRARHDVITAPAGVRVPPVAVFAFNRPELTRQTFDAVRRAEPPELFVFCDGPRPGHAGDEVRCREVREIFEEIDWDCEVHRCLRDENIGCSASLELGLDEVFANVSEAIVLEDDCVADPSFFAYCGELLQRYRDDHGVSHVAGFALDTPEALFGGASYAFASLAGAWGWATWSTRWQEHRARFPRSWEDGGDVAVPDAGARDGMHDRMRSTVVSAGMRRALADFLRDAAAPQTPWDVLWALSVTGSGARAITPAVNLVEMVGFTIDATHNTAPTTLPRAGSLRLPLVHPDSTAINADVSREVEFDALWFPVGRAVRGSRRAVPVGMARTAVLRVLTSAGVVGARASYWRAGAAARRRLGAVAAAVRRQRRAG